MTITRFDPGPRMSQGVVAGGLLFTAGQTDTTQSDVTGQMRVILAKIDAILERAGSNRSHLVSASIWLTDIATFAEMNAVWESWIDLSAPPARATVESRLANPKYLVEVSVVAAVLG